MSLWMWFEMVVKAFFRFGLTLIKYPMPPFNMALHICPLTDAFLWTFAYRASLFGTNRELWIFSITIYTYMQCTVGSFVIFMAYTFVSLAAIFQTRENKMVCYTWWSTLLPFPMNCPPATSTAGSQLQCIMERRCWSLSNRRSRWHV